MSVLATTAVPWTRVDVTSDTAEWEDERRGSLGASETPAVLGVSPWATPLDVWRSKRGDAAAREIDPELAFIGHAEEVTIGKWLRRFRPDLGLLRRGFMARSDAHPWLHASFDRFLVQRDGTWVPVQMKTAHQYASSEWADDAAPLPVQVQVQTELLVWGAPYGYAVAFIGGRRFHVVRIDRDEEFIRDVLLPDGERFWRDHVETGIAPDPTTYGEAVALWAGRRGEEFEADADTIKRIDAIRAHQRTVKQLEAFIDEHKLVVAQRMQNATELIVRDGERTITLATWRPTAGARRLDGEALRADHPDLADAYTRAGTPSRQFRLTPIKEQA